MKHMLIISLKLALICAIAAIALGGINSITAPRIEELGKENLDKALKELIEEGTRGEKVVVSEDSNAAIKGYYPINDNNNNYIGYIIEINGSGYGGAMEILAAYNTDGTITKALLMKNEETPGLGKKAENPEYMNKYIGTGGDVPVPISKSMLGGGDNSKSQEKIELTILEWWFGRSSGADAVGGATTDFTAVGPENSSPDAVSGATITFVGIGKALEYGSEYVKQNLRGVK